MTDEEFTALYPTTPNPELMRLLGCSMVTVTRRARRLGLKKDDETRYAHMKQPKSTETKARMSASQKGRTFTDEARAKMSAARTGRPLTQAHRASISKANKGKPKSPEFVAQRTGRRLSDEERAARHARMAERGTLPAGANHYNWKGGIVDKPFLRRSDRRHRLWREAVLNRDGFTCQECGRIFAPGQRGLHAHHLKPFAKYVDVRYDPDNGVALCTRCHRNYHTIVQVQDYERIDKVPCACGCGEMMYPITLYGQSRRFLPGHVQRGRKRSAESRARISQALKGRKRGPFTDEHRQRISAGRKGKGLGMPSPKKGWKNSYITEEQFIALWPTTTSRQLAEMCRWTESNVCVWGKKLGLPPRYTKRL